MGEIDGVIYDDTECELFCWHVAEITDVIAKMRANMGDTYADAYIDELTGVIRRRGGAPS